MCVVEFILWSKINDLKFEFAEVLTDSKVI